MKILSFKLLVVGLLLYCVSYAQIPTITGFNPRSGLPGTTVVISGNGFDGVTATNNVVYFGDHLATVNSSTATSLSVTFPLGASSSKITVINKNTKLEATSNLLFTPVFPNDGVFNNYSFQELPNINLVSGIAYDMETIDLNNDTYPDIAMADYNSPLIVAQNVSNPSGIAFANLISYTNLSTDPDVSIAKGDLDGDGKYDIIIGNNNNTLSVFNNTSGNSIDISTFASPFTLAGVNSVRDIAIADLNGDGKPDIICTNSSGDMVIFQNNYAGGVLSSASFGSPVVLTGTFDRLVTSDFNNDGQPDMIAVGQSTSQITFFQNKLFGASINALGFTITSIASPANCFSLDCGDLDGDDKIDLVITDNINSGAVYIYKNISTGTSITFDSPLSITPFYNAKEVSIADLDGDTRPDIAIACTDGSSSTNFIIKNSTVSNTITGSSFSSIASLDNKNNNGYIYGQKIADFDNDGKPDIGMVTYNGNANTYNISVYKNTFGFTPTILGVLPLLPRQGDAVSIIGQYFDGSIVELEIGGSRVNYTIVNPNLILSNVPYGITNGNIYMDYSKGTQNFPFNIYFTPSITGFSPKFGKPGDKIIINGENFNVNFPTNNIVFFGPVVAEVLSATINTLIVRIPQNAGYGQLKYTNTDTRLSTISQDFFTPSYPGISSITGSFYPTFASVFTTYPPLFINLDAITYPRQKPDIISTHFQSGNYFKSGLVFNNASVNTITDASFTESSSFQDLPGSTFLPDKPRFIDMNGDGILDQLIVQYGNLTYTLGTTYSQPNSPVTITTNPIKFATGDFTGDGRPDIVTYDNSSNLNIYENINGISFSLIVSISGVSARDLNVADMDNDGLLDIILVNFSDIVIYKNNCNATVSGGCFIPSNISKPTPRDKFEIADLNNDSYPEVILYTYSNSPPGINIYKNSSYPGTISLAAPVDLSGYFSGSTNNIKGVAVGDINGDHISDLAITSDNPGSLIRVFQNNSVAAGSISLDAPMIITIPGASLSSIEINDMDGDWRPDIVVSNNNSPGIMILKNEAPADSIYVPVSAINVYPDNNIAVLTTPGGSIHLNIDFSPITASVKSWTYSLDTPNNDFGSFVDSVGNFYGRTNGTYTIYIYPNSYEPALASQSINITVVGQNLFITNFSPSAGVPGSILNVKGSYFSTNPDSNFVLIGGVRAQVLSSDLYSMQVIVPDGARSGLISVTNAQIYQTALSSMPFLPTYNGGSTIDASSLLPIVQLLGSQKEGSMASADLDGDGFTDLVVLNDTSITVFKNISTTPGVNPGIINFTSFTMSPYANNHSVYKQICINIQDINKDGKPDIIVGDIDSLNLDYEVSIYYNFYSNGNLSKTDFEYDYFSLTDVPVSLNTLDIDDDGYLDILVIDKSGNLNTYTSNQDILTSGRQIPDSFGGFGQEIFVAYSPSNIEVGDINNDGIEDVLISRNGNTKILIAPKTALISEGKQLRQACPTCRSGPGIDTSYIDMQYTSDFVKITDIDGDSYPDILSLNYASQSLTVLRNTTGATDSTSFVQAAIITFSGLPAHLDVGDINGDNFPDIVITDTTGYLHVIQNNSSIGNISSTTLNKKIFKADVSIAYPLIADFDNDEKPDIAVSNPKGRNISFFKNFMPSGTGVTVVHVKSIDSTSILSPNRSSLQMVAKVLPLEADSTVIWSLLHNNSSANNNDLTTISGTGLLELNSTTINGIVTVVGTSVSNPNVSGYFVVTVIGKSVTPAISIASNENLTIAGFVASPCYATYELSVPSVTGQSYQWYYNDLNDNYGKNGLKLVGANSNIYKPVVNGHYYVIALDTIAYLYNSYAVTIPGFNSASIIGENLNALLTIVKDDTADSYQWYVDNIPIKNANSRSLNIYYNGTYYLLTKNNTDGCKLKSNEIPVGNENLRSIQESGLIKDSTVENYGPEIQPFDVKVYPNPASGVFTIEVKSQEDINTYEITDLTGRVMESGEMLKSGNKATISANNRNLDKGIYFVTIGNKSQKKCIKVVLE